MVDNAPGNTAVINAQLMAVRADDRHRPRHRHLQELTVLQPSKQKSRFNSGSAGEWRSLDLTMQPGQRLAARHRLQHMSEQTYSQADLARDYLPLHQRGDPPWICEGIKLAQ